MKIKATAIRSKPDVSLNVATGCLELRADHLADAAMLTAIYRSIIGKDKDLSRELIAAAKRVAETWEKEPEFVMKPPRARNQSNG